MMISVEGTGKNQLETGQEVMGNDPVLSHCSSTEKTGVLEHCRVGETKCWFSNFGGVVSDRIPIDDVCKCTVFYSQ